MVRGACKRDFEVEIGEGRLKKKLDSGWLGHYLAMVIKWILTVHIIALVPK